MSSENQDYPDILTSHNYDGIQEFDNPMPFWWKAIFVLTVFWAGFYVFAIEFGFINTYEKNLYAENEEIKVIRAKQKKDAPKVDEAMLLAAVDKEDVIASGAKVYTSTCASCHGGAGEGLIGPNLTDDHWLHGASPMENYNTIVNGVAEKGMPPWGQVLSPEDSIAVTAYIRTLRGTNPPNAKEPQGEKVAN